MERTALSIARRPAKTIDVGIESELDTLLRIRNKRVLARCPRCGERHEWRGRGRAIAAGGLASGQRSRRRNHRTSIRRTQ